MAKKKGFRDWMDEEYYEPEDRDAAFKKKDSKRYDRKKINIQKARRMKVKNRMSHFD